MPMTSRPQDVEGNSTYPRRTFRAIPEVKRSKDRGNGNGYGHGNGSGNYARGSNNSTAVNRTAPPEATNAENFYYLKQMNSKTPMVIVMTDGEEVRGWIEWYDRNCLKVNRDGAPNLLIQKHCIKYCFKQDELA
jgi:host factor-I protein